MDVLASAGHKPNSHPAGAYHVQHSHLRAVHDAGAVPERRRVRIERFDVRSERGSILNFVLIQIWGKIR